MPTSSISFNYNYYPTSGLSESAAILLTLAALVVIVIGVAVYFANTKKQKSLQLKIAGAAIVALGIALGLFTVYKEHAPTLFTPVFAPRTMLETLWENYKQSYVDPNSGRTFDTQNNDDTTSEGESYTMLRAVWMNDETSFDQSWAWTQANLQRPDDHLFSWLYGEKSDGTYGILTSQGGENSATDADTDIALSLVFAYSRWQNPAYLRDALEIIPSIWKNDVFIADGKPYLGASNLAGAPATEEIVDPSYINPYAYRIFATLDPRDDWNELINTSYDVLENSMASPLDKQVSVGLPPDWVEIDTKTGAVGAPVGTTTQDTNFGFDAIRVPWRIALDWEWYHDPRDQSILQQMSFLGNSWAKDQSLAAVYGHDGSITGNYQSPATYGGSIGYFMVADPDAASQVYTQKLESLYSPDTETWTLPLSYYDSNIVWFGMALYNNALPNLFTLNGTSSLASTDP